MRGLIFALIVLLAVACNGGGEALRTATPEVSPSATPATTAAPQATATPSVMERCLASAPDQYVVPVDPAEPSRYDRGIYTIDPDGTGLTLLAGREGMAGLPFGSRTYSLSPGSRSLAFVTGSYPSVTMCLASVDGDEPLRALATFESMWDMALSPNGDQVVVYGRLNDTDGVYLVATQDGAVAPFPTPLDWADGLAWSPTGDQLAFTGEAGPDSPRGLYVVNNDGSGLRLLAEGVIAAAAWSSDGSRIAYAPFSGAEAGILLVDGEGNITRVSNTTPHHRTSLAWTPDGRRIAFVEAGNTDEALPIKVVDVESGGEVLVTTGTSPAWSPDGSRIAFLRDGNLYVVNADGSQETKVTNPSQPFVQEPFWLPDNSALLFAFVPPMAGSVYVVDPDGTDEVNLADGSGPVWSPDGTKIVFRGGGSGPALGSQDNIYVMNSDGTGVHKIGKGFQSDAIGPCVSWRAYAWSPDGRFITYDDDERRAVMLAPADGGSEAEVLVNGTGVDWLPGGERFVYSEFDRNRGECHTYLKDFQGAGEAQWLTEGRHAVWSPDGQRIAFVKNESWGGGDVYVINVDGSGERKLMSVGPTNYLPMAWSPDGSRLAVATGGLFVVDLATGEKWKLSENAHYPPTWSPDGSDIAFAVDSREGPDFIYIVDADGSGEPQLLTEGKAPAWSPDGSRIAFTR